MSNFVVIENKNYYELIKSRLINKSLIKIGISKLVHSLTFLKK